MKSPDTYDLYDITGCLNMQLGRETLSLARAIGVKKGDVVSLVGGGGKTSTMNLLAGELYNMGMSVIMTTTTHIFPPEDEPLLLSGDIREIEEALSDHRLLVLASSCEKEKLKGIDPLLPGKLRKFADIVIVEADGSRNKPFKAPKETEPVIPPSSSVVIPVVGVDAAYKPLSEEWTHRTEKITEITGLLPGETITPDIIAKTILNPMGGMKGVPENAVFVPLINKADTHRDMDIAREISHCLFKRGIKKTIITSHEGRGYIKPYPAGGFVSAVILAAGGSRRMGRPKQELKIGDKTLAEMVIENVLSSIADEIILVTHPGLPLFDRNKYPYIKNVVNEYWETGQSSSMKAGLKAVHPKSNAVMFFMADQPMVEAGIINDLIMTFYESKQHIVAPRYKGKNGSPVLFDRELFSELLAVEGDKGGRDLLKRHAVEYVDIDSTLTGMDVDTPEEYGRLKEIIHSREK